MNRLSKILFSGVISLIVLPISVYAIPNREVISSNQVSNTTSNIQYRGNTVFKSNIEEKNVKYNSTNDDENTILVSSGNISLINPIVNKSGSSTSKLGLYGGNASIFVNKNAKINISGGTINTDSIYAHGIYSYIGGSVNLDNSEITTQDDNSSAIVSRGGNITLNNISAKTKGDNSYAINSFENGTIITNGGTFETSGTGSAIIYSKANVTINKSTLLSTLSEGVIVDGGSVTLNNAVLTDKNSKLSDNTKVYKNIYLLDSTNTNKMSTFLAKNSTITTNKGDTFYVTNANALIALDNNVIVNNDGEFLKIEKGINSKGGSVTLKCFRQKIKGDITLDSTSTLNMILKNNTLFKGSINEKNSAKKIDLNLSKDSIVVLTSDTYIDTLINAVSDNSNIYLNGYKLYVGGKNTSANTGKYDESTYKVVEDNTDIESNITSNVESNKVSNEVKKDNNNLKDKNMEIYCLCGSLALILVAAIMIVSKAKMD